MIRKILISAFLLFHLCGMAQVKLPIYDSLGVYLENTKWFMQGEEDIDIGGWIMPPTHLTTIPVVDGCEGVDKDSIRICMNRYFKNLVQREAQIPETLKDSVFYEKIYFRIVLDENAKIEKIDIPHEPRLPESHRKERRVLLLLEAKRVLDQASFSKPAYQGDRAVKFGLTIPISFSNPPTTKE
jgi:hypothetical protein